MKIFFVFGNNFAVHGDHNTSSQAQDQAEDCDGFIPVNVQSERKTEFAFTLTLTYENNEKII